MLNSYTAVTSTMGEAPSLLSCLVDSARACEPRHSQPGSVFAGGRGERTPTPSANGSQRTRPGM